VAVIYTFSGWSPAIAAVANDITYTAIYQTAAVNYTITFKNWDGSVLMSMPFGYGTTAQYPGYTNPTRPSTNTTAYDFIGWDRELAVVTCDAEYTAQYQEKTRLYAITFYDSDGQTVLQQDYLEYDTMPSFTGSTPTKATTAQYTYTFKGWDHDIVAVAGDAIYVAVYTSTTNIYTVRFLNWDGTLLQQSRLEYGATPYYSKLDPTKAQDVQYTYSFIGWNNSISPVTGDTDYKATFEANIRSYTITFNNYDGTALQSGKWNYGTTPTYNGATPTKASSDPSKRYVFSGWDTTIAEVTGDHTYTAQYTTEDIFYTITFKNYDGTVLQTSQVAGGATPTCATPTRAEDVYYHVYTFTGWTPTVVAASADATYVAQFTPSVQKVVYNATMDSTHNSESSYELHWNTVSPTYTGKAQAWQGSDGSAGNDDLASFTYYFSTDSQNLSAQTVNSIPVSGSFFSVTNLIGAVTMNVDFVCHFPNLLSAQLNFAYPYIGTNTTPDFAIRTSSDANASHNTIKNQPDIKNTSNVTKSYVVSSGNGIGYFIVSNLTNVKTICFSFNTYLGKPTTSWLTLSLTNAIFNFNYPLA